MIDHAIKAVFDRQYGLITRAQALEHGLSPAQIRYRVKSGEWLRIHYGIYRHVMVRVTFHSKLLLGVLATGGIVSHRSAAELHNFAELGHRRRPEVVVEHGDWRPVKGLTVHQSTQIDRVDVHHVAGLPCTGPGRTVIDLGATMRAGQLGRTVDALLQQKRITQAELWDVLIRHSVQGRIGCGPLRLVLEARLGEERVALSAWSYSVANLLESAGLARPRLEYRAHSDDGRFLGQIDLAYPEKWLAIELDSVAFHHNLTSFGGDRSRARGLTVEGWSVLQSPGRTTPNDLPS